MVIKTYTTSQIAAIAGVHPNTVRLYEEWGYIQKAERKDNNYRVFNENHVFQIKLVRAALPGPYPVDGNIVYNLVRLFAACDIEGSLQSAKEYLDKTRIEKERAINALYVLDRWYESKPGDGNSIIYITRKNAANSLGLTTDTLRTWERNGLMSIKRDNKKKAIFTNWDIEKIMVIRLLRNCGYSISSLYKVFGDGEKLLTKPSIVLSLPADGEDISYITDRYMDFLSEHEMRALKLIDMILNYDYT